MKMKTRDWSALLDIYPENKEFTYTENIKAVIDCISSAYRCLDSSGDEIILTSNIFPLILTEENVVVFFIHLYRTGIIDDLYLPITISTGPGEWINYHYAPDYMDNYDVAYRAAIAEPKAFKKNFVSLRIPNRNVFKELFDNVYKKLDVKNNTLTDNKLSFDDTTGTLSFNGRQIEIPINTNQFFLCKKLFDVPVGTRIKEQDVIDMIDWSKDSKRSVYDAMRLVNKRVKEQLDIPELFKWRMNTVWREQ
jgi:hypothetical protein